MQIKQIKTSEAVVFFHTQMAKKYNLKDYHSKRKPVLFFGCYDKGDLKNIITHRGFVLLLWLGTDAMRITSQWAKLLNRPNIHHIAQSEYIAKDLKNAGLKFKRINVAVMDYKPNPQPLGDFVYFYYGRNRESFYGHPTALRVMEKLRDIKFIFATVGKFHIWEMPDIYKKCFIGLRLTIHDGLPETVSEMGMMGRRCVWNGDFPGCYQWKTDQDVINAILKEKENIGKINYKLVEEIENYIEQGTNWLNTEWYQ